MRTETIDYLTHEELKELLTVIASKCDKRYSGDGDDDNFRGQEVKEDV